MRAIWNDTVIAESDDTIVVEGNHYFPADSIVDEHFESIDKTTACPWKGTASYFDVVVAGDRNPGAAWVYRDPKTDAEHIRDHLAFWNGVTVEP